MKAENLQLMNENKINIPRFKIYSFNDLINTEKLKSMLVEFKKQGSSNFCLWSEKLQACISLKEELAFKLNYTAYAVRSSCNQEDGDNFSFAGVFESFLDVKEDDLPKKVLECVKSLYSIKALEYIKLNKIDIEKLTMNVIVQEMIKGDISGIFFTANPQGIINESVITAAKGRGDLLVNDVVDSISYFYHQTDKSFFTDKEVDLLSFDMLNEIIETGEKIKAILNLEYADIEFVILNNVLYILQARPITCMNVDNLIVLDNSNIVESYPGVNLPLTESFAGFVYQGVFNKVAQRILQDNKKVKDMQDVFSQMVDSVNGRMYYRINNWYSILQFLPLSKKIIPIWQDMLGVKIKNYDKKRQQSFFGKIKTSMIFIKELFLCPKNMEKLNIQFLEVYEYFNKQNFIELSNHELVAFFDEIKNKLLSVWDITLINDMYAFIFTGLLKMRLKHKYPNNFEEMTVNFIGGITQMESMKPIRELYKLSLMEKGSKKYEESFKTYLEMYGDRTIEELKLETETFRINPELLEKTVDDYRADSTNLRKVCNEELSNTAILKQKGIIRYLASKAMLGIKNRETSRLNRCRIFGMVRTIVLSMGNNLYRDGLLESVNDVFYLKLDELFKLVNYPENMMEIIAKRKLLYKEYSLMPTYSRLIFIDENAKNGYYRLAKHKQIHLKDVWHGTASSGGIVSAEVVVIKNPADATDVKNKIIVTKMTDPGWVFVLANAKGIITEKGSLLSHTAIISRELKIPAVVGVDDILEGLNNGDKVLLNGNSGEIRLLKE